MMLRANCLCGSTTLTLKGAPVARAICHCGSCRDFYASAMLSATAWNAEAVEVEQGTTTVFQHPYKQLSKTFCTGCGDVLFGTNRLGMRVVPNALVARALGGALTGPFAPTMHLFYRDRIVDVIDALPKFLDGWDGPTYDAASA